MRRRLDGATNLQLVGAYQLELSESRDMIMSLLSAVEKRRAADAALVAEQARG